MNRVVSCGVKEGSGVNPRRTPSRSSPRRQPTAASTAASGEGWRSMARAYMVKKACPVYE